MTNDDSLYTIYDAATYLKVHWQTIRNYIDKGYIHPIKIGRTLRIKKTELLQFNENINEIREVELRFRLSDAKNAEEKIRKLGGILTNHSHIVDHYYCLLNIKNMKDKDEWFDSPRGFGLRIRQFDNDYSGRTSLTMEIKKLAGPDYTDHSNCLETEIEVNDFNSAETFIMMMGNKKFMVIDKERIVYKLDGMKFCFDKILDYGEGLEIEKITNEPIEVTKRSLMDAAKKIGLSKKELVTNSFTYEAMTNLAKF